MQVPFSVKKAWINRKFRLKLRKKINAIIRKMQIIDNSFI
jgi:hypothetical protein